MKSSYIVFELCSSGLQDPIGHVRLTKRFQWNSSLLSWMRRYCSQPHRKTWSCRHHSQATNQKQSARREQIALQANALLYTSRNLFTAQRSFLLIHRDLIPPSYRPPQKGLISFLPSSWIPYAELIRLDKPTGSYYLFFPCLFSTLMAGSYTASAPLPVLGSTALFFAGAIIMRGAGCTVNDLWDRNLDPLVTRTRCRPIARGAITPFNALTFAGIQMLAGLGILLQFPAACLYYGIPSLLLVATYPLAKRVTHYPQLVLGLTFSWGAIMGFPALGIDLIADSVALKAVVGLYASCVAWTVLYDIIYAHMDIKDDAKAGIKSMALRHEKATKGVLSALAVIQVSLLALSGLSVGAGLPFYVGSCGSAAVNLGLMIWKVRLKEISSCWWWFRKGAWFTGGGIVGGLLMDFWVKRHQARRVEYMT